jgi:hypothetical protein
MTKFISIIFLGIVTLFGSGCANTQIAPGAFLGGVTGYMTCIAQGRKDCTRYSAVGALVGGAVGATQGFGGYPQQGYPQQQYPQQFPQQGFPQQQQYYPQPQIQQRAPVRNICRPGYRDAGNDQYGNMVCQPFPWTRPMSFDPSGGLIDGNMPVVPDVITLTALDEKLVL